MENAAKQAQQAQGWNLSEGRPFSAININFEARSAVLGQNEGKKDKRHSVTACSYYRIYYSKKGMYKINNCS